MVDTKYSVSISIITSFDVLKYQVEIWEKRSAGMILQKYLVINH